MAKSHTKLNLAFIFAICSISILLSNIALEAEHTPPTGRVNKLLCPKKGRCYWTSESDRREISFYVKATLTDLLAGVLASLLLVIGECKAIPYGHLPWLFISFKSLLSLQGPSIIKFGYTTLSVDKYTAVAFLVISVFLYVEEWSLWFEMFNSCKALWRDRKKELNRINRKTYQGKGPSTDETADSCGKVST